jgi:flavin-dependent dehydrogenase
VKRYDAVIVGARCAGAATALLLARRGYRVLLVDRGWFATEIPHGHYIHRHGPRRLWRWGLLERIAARCPAVTSITMDLGDFPLTGRDLVVDGIAAGYAPRRSTLDALLVAAAGAAGAELRPRFNVTGLLREGDVVTGIRGHGAGGAEATERAAITIGADGRHSFVAGAVGAPTYEAEPPAAFYYFSYWRDMPDRGLEILIRAQAMVFSFPTNDGLTGVFVGWRIEHLDRVRRDIEASFMAVVDGVPEYAERLRSGRRAERFGGAIDLSNFLRQPCGPGWALVGDAGCHKDPMLALGICDALRDAELLSDAVDAALGGRQAWPDALAGYERSRNAATLADYRENLAAARLEPPPPSLLQLRRRLRDDPAATRQFFLAREGIVEEEQGNEPGPGLVKRGALEPEPAARA